MKTGYFKLFLLATAGFLIGFGVYYFYYRVSPVGLKFSTSSFQALEQPFGEVVPLLILGSGPAGLSAALYGARARIATTVLAGPISGGQLMGTSYVENWPATLKERGPELIAGLRKQAEGFGAQIINDTAQSINLSKWPFELTTVKGRKISALSLVLATGADPKKLEVEGEDRYWGLETRGVSACATCDAPGYKDKSVVVVGGGDSAIEEATHLASYAREVTLLVRKNTLRAAPTMQERLKQYPTIKVKYNTQVNRILGDETGVTAVELRDSSTDLLSEFATDGVFLAIGHTPNSSLVKDQVACDDDGYILLKDRNQHTSVSGVFAAGDVSDRIYKQAGVAAGDGIKAGLDAQAFLRDHLADSFKVGQVWQDIVSGISKTVRYFNAVELPEIQEIASQDELNKLLQKSLPVVIDFFGPACPQCVRLLPHVQSLALQLKDKAHFVKVDVTMPGISDQYQVKRIPAIMVFKNGKTAAFREGYMSEDELKNLVQAVL